MEPFRPDFEYDPEKSRSNLEKHGIDFRTAERLWLDTALLSIPARTWGEARYMGIGRLGGVTWSAIFTIRNSRIRLISVRRSRPSEQALYEDQRI